MLSALLLVRVRSNPVLLELSRGNIPRNARLIALTRVTRVARGPGLGLYSCANILLRLRASVSYLNAAMRAIKSIRVGQGQGQTDVFCLVGDIATGGGNHPGLWEQTHEWIPRDIATMNDTGLGRVKGTLFLSCWTWLCLSVKG